MSELYFLGTGGAVATEARDNTALLLHHGQDLALVDCPGSVTRKIKTLGLDPRAVCVIQVTHVHPDHIYGLPSFVHSLMLADLRIRLFAAEESIHFCRELLGLYGLQDESIRCRIEFRAVGSGDRFEPLPGVECQAFHVPHKESSLAFAWSFPENGKTLLYSGDTPIFTPLFKQAAGVDTLIHDCSVPSRYFQEYPFLPSMHTNALDLGRMAQEARIKRLIPCHFFGELDFDMDEIALEIREHYKGDLVIPRDLMRVEL
jgi:ribonuclease Z